VVGVVSASAATSRTATSHYTVHIVTKQFSAVDLDLGDHGPSAGDQYVRAGTMTVNGRSDGYSSAHCVFTATGKPTLFTCRVDYSTARGLLSVEAFGAPQPGHPPVLRAAVIGGTCDYRNVRGDGTIRPNPTGTDVTLDLIG